ncbi:MAG: ATP-binding cassette domain-containing protein, partial [Spirochaetaceae bacterium]|nr:ATP-binding cassette domain-containing protein [Spirochaetaceae bacterium]
MAKLQLKQISLAYGDRDILQNISLNLTKKNRMALSGANGCGKSTLLKIIAGLQEADSGKIILQKNAKIGYLPQWGLVFKGRSLKEELEQAYVYFHQLEEEIHSIGDKLQQPLDENLRDRLRIELHEKQEELNNSSYYLRVAEMERVILGLGFKREVLEKESSTFSGGWQMRIALAKVLLTRPHFLLLDEPTNYLDLEARIWLTEYLQGYPGGIIVVSHDRYFLDNLVDHVAEIFLGKFNIYPGNYSRYQKIREEELEQIQDAWKQQQKEISKIE